MIQRIQTLYLLISTILLSLLFVLPSVETIQISPVIVEELNDSHYIWTFLDNRLFTFSLGIIILTHLIIIFDYKKRVRQLKMIIYTIFLLLIVLGMFYYIIYNCGHKPEIHFYIAAIFPLIAIVLDYLAFRAIRKDEELVRSADRIR